MSTSEKTLARPDISYSLKGIRSIEMRFDIIKKTHDEFIMFRNNEIVGRIFIKHLDDKTFSKLLSLADWELEEKC